MNTWDITEIIDNNKINIFVDAVQEQAGKLSQELKEELRELTAFAKYIVEKPDPFIHGLYLDTFKRKTMRIEANKWFQTWLMKNGFDSIKYKNKVEPSMVDQTDYSYILFKPQQFKTVTAKRFDPTVSQSRSRCR